MNKNKKDTYFMLKEKEYELWLKLRLETNKQTSAHYQSYLGRRAEIIFLSKNLKTWPENVLKMSLIFGLNLSLNVLINHVLI